MGKTVLFRWALILSKILNLVLLEVFGAPFNIGVIKCNVYYKIGPHLSKYTCGNSLQSQEKTEKKIS